MLKLGLSGTMRSYLEVTTVRWMNVMHNVLPLLKITLPRISAVMHGITKKMESLAPSTMNKMEVISGNSLKILMKSLPGLGNNRSPSVTLWRTSQLERLTLHSPPLLS